MTSQREVYSCSLLEHPAIWPVRVKTSTPSSPLFSPALRNVISILAYTDITTDKRDGKPHSAPASSAALASPTSNLSRT